MKNETNSYVGFLCIKYSKFFKHFIEQKPLIFWRVKKHQLTIFQIKICCCILTASWQQFTVNKINSKKVANFGHLFQNYITYIFFTRFLYTYTCIKSTKNKNNKFFFYLQIFLESILSFTVCNGQKWSYIDLIDRVKELWF